MTLDDLILALETARAANAAAMHASTLMLNVLRKQAEEEGVAAAAVAADPSVCECPMSARRKVPTMGHPNRSYCTICTKEHDV